ncbi:TetR/AcrR family transcriptional regulator [Nocardioides sp. SYSU D00038]|uniref:TetR/AcrR family transcriptional regulator n=1 Tax=Nocardioides sp. SYSU D00038 TaxID=2812554 RepID=UPI001967C85C|nr:TetR/AcrR family transcriptional regulator [Nocardioides sp. SYSU D00038]
MAVPRNHAERHAARRVELAESALHTLGELGYARTTLREVANHSEFSHGVVHYYFHDKLELIIYAVRHYKAQCVTRYDGVVSDSTSPDDLVDRFAAKLVETLEQEAPMHRLWYDLRTQSMFEEELREAVTLIDATLEEMVWRVVTRYAELAGRAPVVDSSAAYGVLDGLFQQSLLAHLTGTGDALGELVARVQGLLPLLLSPASDPGGERAAAGLR